MYERLKLDFDAMNNGVEPEIDAMNDDVEPDI